MESKLKGLASSSRKAQLMHSLFGEQQCYVKLGPPKSKNSKNATSVTAKKSGPVVQSGDSPIEPIPSENIAKSNDMEVIFLGNAPKPKKRPRHETMVDGFHIEEYSDVEGLTASEERGGPTRQSPSPKPACPYPIVIKSTRKIVKGARAGWKVKVPPKVAENNADESSKQMEASNDIAGPDETITDNAPTTIDNIEETAQDIILDETMTNNEITDNNNNGADIVPTAVDLSLASNQPQSSINDQDSTTSPLPSTSVPVSTPSPADPKKKKKKKASKAKIRYAQRHVKVAKQKLIGGKIKYRSRLIKPAVIKSRISRSVRAGLTMPVGKIHRQLRSYFRGASRLSSDAPVFMTGALEYLVYEVLSLAGESAQKRKRKRIIPLDLEVAVRCDDELAKVFDGVTIPESGGGGLSRFASK